MSISYHPVTTKNKEAQEAFDRGLTAIYAFNYDEAIRSFDRATQLDPQLAMAYWGLALALDQNLETKTTLIHAKLTFDVCQKALELAHYATPKEQAYIRALEKRFSEDANQDKTELRKKYALAMEELVSQFPDDLDAATLYAESLMDLLFWDLWKPNREPFSKTIVIMHVLEAVLKRNPFHLGANHYYIHAVENSPHPEQGLASAYRLYFMDVEWGHLIHTPSHIFMRVGLYDLAAEVNEKAMEADKKYIEVNGVEGRYPLKYFSHALSYLTLAYLWQERYEPALSAAQELETFVHSYATNFSSFEYERVSTLKVYLYFHQWEEILKYPQPPFVHKIANTFWAFAQAMAYASLNQLEKAEEFKDQFVNFKGHLITDSQEVSFESIFFGIAEKILNATICRTKGHYSEAIHFLEKAVEKQTNLLNLTWFYPICQTLGAVLIEADKVHEAERIFRKALEQAPRNGRSLYGLLQTLNLQGKNSYSLTRECKDALRYSTKILSLNAL